MCLFLVCVLLFASSLFECCSSGMFIITPYRQHHVTPLLSLALFSTVCKNLFALLAIDALFVSFQKSDLENPPENFVLVRGVKYGILSTPTLRPKTLRPSARRIVAFIHRFIQPHQAIEKDEDSRPDGR